MHVLLIGGAPRVFSVGNFQWPDDIASALRRLGHSVTRFHYRGSWAESPSVTNRLSGVAGMTRALCRYQQARLRHRDKQLLRVVRSLRPDLVLVLKGEVFSGEVLAEIKRMAPGPLVAWWTDDPWDYPASVKHLGVFDHVFIWDRSYLSRLTEVGVRCAHYLPVACNEIVHRPMRLNGYYRRKLACDVVFVAWYCPEREAVVRALARDFDIGVWGGDWRSLNNTRTPAGIPVVRGPAISPRTATRIYNVSKIGLNIHAAQTHLGGLNTRTFELLANGVFQLIDHVAGIEQLLTPDEEIVCYKSPDEARQLVKRYLIDDEARFRIAAKGRTRVLEEHTYVCRMRTLCALASGSQNAN